MGDIKLTIDEWDIVKKIKAYISNAKTTITKGLIWIETGRIDLKGTEDFNGKNVYIFDIETFDCDVNTGARQSSLCEVGKYIFIKDKVENLEAYKYEIVRKKRKTKRG